jgi:hypothetical protein
VFVDGLHGIVAHILPSKQFAQFFAHRVEPSVDNGMDFADSSLIFNFQLVALTAGLRDVNWHVCKVSNEGHL